MVVHKRIEKKEFTSEWKMVPFASDAFIEMNKKAAAPAPKKGDHMGA